MKSFGIILVVLLISGICSAEELSVSAPKKTYFKMFQPNYFIFGYNTLKNIKGDSISDTDVEGFSKYRISFLYELTNLKNHNIFFHYTQVSFWNIGQESSPFAETNYRPGVMYHVQLKNRYVHTLLGGLYHESNGEKDTRSKSLDVSIEVIAQRQDTIRNSVLKSSLRLFYSPEAFIEENPEYHTYMGYHNLFFELTFREYFVLEFLTRGFLLSNKGAFRFGFISKTREKMNALFTPGIYIQWYYGYGESLLNYKTKSNSVRGGIIFRY
ncbi:MAG: phospholipase A [Fibrobacterales bacterium]